MQMFNPSLFRWLFLCLLVCWAGCSPPARILGLGVCPLGYVFIAPGTFLMGSPADEDGREGYETQQSVTITRAYCMKATEVTQGEWQSVMGNNPSEFKNCGANCPVERVSWADALRFSNALSRREGLPECYSGSKLRGLNCTGYRLPTEAEWEYAARAGTTGAADENLGSVAWYSKNAGRTTHPVRQKEPNAWGLYDMLGNVWEWTGDRNGTRPANRTHPAMVTDPTGDVDPRYRLFRGGSWLENARHASNPLLYARAGLWYEEAGNRHSTIGFRLVKTEP